MIRRGFFSVVVFLSAVSYASAPSMESLKQMVLDKRLDEVAKVLRSQNKEFLASSQNQKQINSWFRTFQYDMTLGQFEKALDMDSQEQADERLKILMTAYEKEPYNLRIIALLVPTLWSLKKVTQAKEIIDKAEKEMPFLPHFRLFHSWLSDDDKHAPDVCDSPFLEAPEKEFCYLLKLKKRLQEVQIGPKDRQVKNYLQKISIPNKYILLWDKWKNSEDKEKYLSSCRALSGKSKKVYFFVPDLCLKDVSSEVPVEE